MFVDQKRKVIFIHNPKTAGSSLIRSFGYKEISRNNRFSHTRPQEAVAWIFQDTWPTFYSFTFVRNPWDRYVSLYHYQRSTEFARFSSSALSHTRARRYSFAEWLEVNEFSQEKSNWFGTPQIHWCWGVTEVFLYEDYAASIKRLSEMHGYPRDILKLNMTSRRHYKEYYDSQALIDLVARIDSEVIERFGYSY